VSGEAWNLPVGPLAAASKIEFEFEFEFDTPTLQVKPGDALADPWLLSHTSRWADDMGFVLDNPPRHGSTGF